MPATLGLVEDGESAAVVDAGRLDWARRGGRIERMEGRVKGGVWI